MEASTRKREDDVWLSFLWACKEGASAIRPHRLECDGQNPNPATKEESRGRGTKDAHWRWRLLPFYYCDELVVTDGHRFPYARRWVHCRHDESDGRRKMGATRERETRIDDPNDDPRVLVVIASL